MGRGQMTRFSRRARVGVLGRPVAVAASLLLPFRRGDPSGGPCSDAVRGGAGKPPRQRRRSDHPSPRRRPFGLRVRVPDGQERLRRSDRTRSITAMLSWSVTAVRVPLNEDCWLGINGAPAAVSGANYRGAIANYVARLQDYGLVVILDLHWAAPGNFVASGEWPMADADHAQAFWRSVALTFATDHGVIFDLFNEPYVTSWRCWLHGCTARHRVSGKLVTYTTVGMQRLVNVVRSTGAPSRCWSAGSTSRPTTRSG